MTNLKSFDNSWYRPGKNKLIRTIWYITNSILYNSYLLPLSSVKRCILRLFGAKIGKGVVLKPKINIKYPWKLKVGDYSWIGENVWIDNLDLIDIGKDVCVSQGAMLLCGNHDYTKTSFDLITKPIILKNSSWVGAKAIICPGTIVGEETVITVGSVANKTLEPNAIYQGNPCKKIKQKIKTQQ